VYLPWPGTRRRQLAHDGYDARCLFADGTLLTPAGCTCAGLRAAHLHRRPGIDLVEASDGEPSEQHLFRITAPAGARWSRPPG
jgi:dipeptidyl-peptidase-4